MEDVSNVNPGTVNNRKDPSGGLKGFMEKHHIGFAYDPIYTVILIGIAGMLSAIFLFTGGDKPYGEIILENKVELTDMLLNNRLSNLRASIKIWQGKIDSIKKVTGADPELAKTWGNAITKAQVDIRNTDKEILLLNKGNLDTSINYFNKYIYIKRADFGKGINDDGWVENGSIRRKVLKVELIDTICRSTILYPGKTTGTLKLMINTRATKIAFFKDYPLFGLWLIFSIAQMVLWFMTPPLLIGSLNNLKVKIGGGYSIDRINLLFNCIGATLLSGLFLYVFCVVLVDQPIVSNNYFLQYYKVRAYTFVLIGYTAASFCFGVFVTVAKELDRVNKVAVKNSMSRIDDTGLNAKYLALKGIFDNSFICSALILSFCVIWSGILVNAVNTTEAFSFYFNLSGKAGIPNDFVYLLGLMNTMLLLVFYIPVKLKFNSLMITQDTPTSSDKNALTAFRGISESLGPLLVTVSPLLASLLQNLFKIFA